MRLWSAPGPSRPSAAPTSSLSATTRGPSSSSSAEISRPLAWTPQESLFGLSTQRSSRRPSAEGAVRLLLMGSGWHWRLRSWAAQKCTREEWRTTPAEDLWLLLAMANIRFIRHSRGAIKALGKASTLSGATHPALMRSARLADASKCLQTLRKTCQLNPLLPLKGFTAAPSLAYAGRAPSSSTTGRAALSAA